MRNPYGWRRLLLLISLVVSLDMSGCAGVGVLPFGDPSWKEEVLLHDGTRIIVRRSQSYGGRHEPGQSSPVKEQTMTFTLPNTGTTLEFKSDYGEDIGRANFQLIALHILHSTPYIVTVPNLCPSYIKWGGQTRRMCCSDMTARPGNASCWKNSQGNSRTSIWSSIPKVRRKFSWRNPSSPRSLSRN